MVQDLHHVPPKDFFISYNKADRRWAEWIAWQLEKVQHSTVLQAWDFQAGSNFVLEMDKAAKVAGCIIAVLSPDYLNADYNQAEWAAAFRRDPKGEKGALLPVRVQKCEVEGLLRSIVYIDLVDLDELAARERLLEGVRRECANPDTASAFPGAERHTVPEPQRFPGALPPTWNVPYPRNPYFTGREDILKRLYEVLRIGKTAAITQPQVISGLGGIGKTQSAVEYAYRYRNDYQVILWARAENRETLISDFVSITGLLNLPEQDTQDQSITVDAVKRWLKDHTDWLLILDNADDLAVVSEFIPPAFGGHILLTTRAQPMGRLAQCIEIETMEPEEGALFLLRRANNIAQDTPLDKASEGDRTKAREISQTLGGLPLALDQAGTYIEETTCSLSDYLDLYRTRHTELLKRRGGLVSDRPEPVATTWSLSFEKVEQANPAAAELLRLCAFLAPDVIPEEIIIEGAPNLGPILQPAANPFELNQAIEELCKFSLVKRDPGAKTLTIHRLVQAVIKDGMKKSAQRRWAERSVRAVNQAFPDVKFETWPRCQRCLPHAQACAELIGQWGIAFVEAARLLNRVGWYLRERGQYALAEPFLQQALVIYEQALGSDHLEVATSLNNLGLLYRRQGKYVEAEALFQHALSVCEKHLDPADPQMARSLNNLAMLNDDQGEYGAAELLYQQALAIDEQVFGPDHPQVATDLNNLAWLYYIQEKYAQAELLHQRALAIHEKTLGLEHLDTATSLHHLAFLYKHQGKYANAEVLYQRILAIYEKTLGPNHPKVATVLANYAYLLRKMGRKDEASRLEKRVRAIQARYG